MVYKKKDAEAGGAVATTNQGEGDGKQPYGDEGYGEEYDAEDAG